MPLLITPASPNSSTAPCIISKSVRLFFLRCSIASPSIALNTVIIYHLRRFFHASEKNKGEIKNNALLYHTKVI